MRIALLICGNPRSFVFKNQINTFKELIKKLPENTDVFILFKLDEHNKDFFNYIKSEEGLNNLKKQIDNLKPVYLKFFDKFRRFNDKCYYSQIKTIDILLSEAEKYSKKNDFRYDYFLRYRPDFVFYRFDINFSKLNKLKIYTSEKFDSIASDQVIIISHFMYYNWWLRFVKLTLKKEGCFDRLPEFLLYQPLRKPRKVLQLNKIIGGLCRRYKVINNWGNKVNFCYYWNDYDINEYNKLLKKIKFTKLIEFLNDNDYTYVDYID